MWRYSCKKTAEILSFKIKNESSTAAGIRRIEAITANALSNYYNNLEKTIEKLSGIIKNKDLIKGVEDVLKENKILSKKMESYKSLEVNMLEKYLVTKSVEVNSVRVIAEIVDIDADAMKNLSFKLRGKEENLIMMLIAEKSDKVFLTIMITDDLVDKGLNASIMIREVSKEVNGGGGGQSFFATAGGSDSSGLSQQ